MNFDFLQGWIIYPLSEAVHALQGVLTGFLATRGIIHREISDAIIALLLTAGFAIYEITEQWKIGDAAYQDFENFWLTAVVTGLIYVVIHLWRKHIWGRRYGE